MWVIISEERITEDKERYTAYGVRSGCYCIGDLCTDSDEILRFADSRRRSSRISGYRRKILNHNSKGGSSDPPLFCSVYDYPRWRDMHRCPQDCRRMLSRCGCGGGEIPEG